MDNYNLSNSLLSGRSVDSGEHHSWLTDEENRRATFSGRSANVSTSEQVQRQQLPSTGDEQIPEQRVLANFDISSASTTSAAATTVDEPEDPFAALAAYHYQILTFNGDTGQPLNSNLGLFGNINTSSETVLAELEGNDVVERPEQSQGKSDRQGIIIPEIAIPDTVSDKRSGRKRASEPRSFTKESIDRHVRGSSSRRSKRKAKKRQKLDSKETRLSPSSRATATRCESAAKPETSATSQEIIGPVMDESLRVRVKKETDRWIVRRDKGLGNRFACGYPDCGHSYNRRTSLRVHIFNHIHISRYKCSYPECGDNMYFRHTGDLRRHVHKCHTNERPYHCEKCDSSFTRLDNLKRHMYKIHKIAL